VRVRLLLLTVVSTFAVGVGSAAAATVGVKPLPAGDEAVIYLAGAGERNDLRVERVGERAVRVEDAGATIAPADGCRPEDGRPGAVTCFVGDLQRWEVIAGLGDGDDAFTGLAARKTSVDGGPGNDRLTGDPASRTAARHAEVGREDDSLGEENRLAGGPGDDLLVGGAGMDSLVGGPGDDRLQGGAGQDDLCGDEVRSFCVDTVAGNDVLDGGSWHDTLTGAAGDDVLVGGHGHDLLDGRSGNDWLDAATGEQPLARGPGGFLHEAVLTGPGQDIVLARDGVYDRVVCPGEGSSVERQGGDKGLDHDTGDQVLCAAPGEASPPPIRLPSSATLRDGTVRALVRCASTARGGCTGTLEVRRTGREPASARRLGRARYDLDAGQRRTVRVRLPARARRSVARRVPGRVVLQARPARGSDAGPSMRRVALKTRRR